jgi:hypothetical protein
MTERPILFSAPMVRALLSGRKTQTRRVVKPQPGPYAGGVRPGHTAKHPAPYLDSYCSEPKTTANPRGMSRDWCWWTEDDRQGPMIARCLYGEPGDRLWVRETWCPLIPEHFHESGKPRDFLSDRYGTPRRNGAAYRADSMRLDGGKLREDFDSERCRKELGYPRWTPAIHMPRWASRLTLEVTGVRVERLQAITEEDARAEGASSGLPDDGRASDIALNEWCRWTKRLDPRAGVGSQRGAFAYLWEKINGRGAWAVNPWVWVVEFRRVAP